jgi:hypothetical protein
MNTATRAYSQCHSAMERFQHDSNVRRGEDVVTGTLHPSS